MKKYDEITDLLAENVQTVIENLPHTRVELEVLDAAEAEGKDRRMVRRAISDAMKDAIASEEAVIPEPQKDWPTHEHRGRPMCLVPHYRFPGQEMTHFVIGPLSDNHPLHIAEVRERLKSCGGGLSWMDPYKCDDIEWEPLPASIHAAAPDTNQIMKYGSGAIVSDAEILSRW